jgi:RimJ/RimL family protein N-acetyltransferase
VTDQSGDLIQTARLSLVPLSPGDADEMVEVLGDRRLYEFIGGQPPTLVELRATYARLAAGHPSDRTEEWRNWTVRRRADGQAVGTVQATITADGGAAEVAWMVGANWQRQGFASEAAQALVTWLEARGVRIIAAHVHPAHHASAAVAARAGLTPTGTYHDGEQLWQRLEQQRR